MLRTDDLSQDPFHLFVEGVVDYAIFMLDAEGHVATWNAGAERIKGYKPSEIIGKHFSVFYSEEDVRNGKPQRLLRHAIEHGHIEDEGWRIRNDGSRFWADVTLTAVRNAAGELIGFSKVTRDCTERMQARQQLERSEQKLRESERSLRELSLHLLRTQDEERRLIGREMHDSLGQVLSVLKMRLDAMSASDETVARVTRKQLAECSHLADECAKEVRTVSYLLYPPMLEEMGLKAAIPWYLEGFSKRSGIKTLFEAPDVFERLHRDIELVIFRVLQESLTNVHKHSGSTDAKVKLMLTGDAVILEVTDSGEGSPAAVVEASSNWTGSLGVGLRGMSERLRQLGGTLAVSTGEGGTQVRASVPVKYPTDAAL
jgi:PAS domain S-box-containing protein